MRETWLFGKKKEANMGRTRQIWDEVWKGRGYGRLLIMWRGQREIGVGRRLLYAVALPYFEIIR